jgi:transposase
LQPLRSDIRVMAGDSGLDEKRAKPQIVQHAHFPEQFTLFRDRQTIRCRQRLQIVATPLVVERTIAWLNRNRRLAKDFEATIASAEAWLMIASVKLLSRRLARA